jgi:hypothetical protein
VAVTGITGELRTYTTVFNMAVPIGGAVRTKAIAYTNRDPSYVFAPGTNIEGSISGATGTVVSDSNPTPGATDGYLVITTTGTAFEFKDDIVDTSDSNTYAVASSGLYGRVTLTPTRPAGVTDLGLVAGDYIYFDTGAYTGMAGGAKVIVDSTATTITYNDTVTGDASSTQATAFSVDPTGLISGTGGAVVAGDIMYLGGTANTDVDGSNHHLLFNNPVKIASVDANKRHLTATIPVGGPASGVLTWKRVNNAALATFFPLTATTAGALAGTSFASACPVTATSVGTGAGAMSNATYESAELGAATASTYFYPMVDGINWVRSTNTPTVSTDYTFTLKSTISAGLSGSSVDFNHEQIVLVPVTTKNVVDWLNSPAISGLFSASTVANASGLVQIAAKTTGGLGSVKVDGGSANSVAALIAGSVASTGGGTYGLSVATSDAAGLAGGSWVRIQNSLPNTKTAINASTGLTSISGGLVTLSGTPAWTWANTATGIINTTWQVEAQGGFWKWTSGTSFAAAMSGITEGDWVRIGSVSGAALNLGVFRVVRADTANGAFWIENPSGVESYASYDCQFITYDSIVPGDTLIMDSPVWGSVGSWTVTGISASNTSQFTVTGLADSGAVGALGSSSSWVRIVESTPSSMVKQILGIVTDPAVPSLTKITFNGSAIGGEALGTTIVPLDKLKFPSNNSYGLDGYSHTTGLIEEANRIVYGDPQGSYEGVAAAGVGIDITGPVVRHVSVGVAVRASGSQSIATRIQSAVAGIINASPTGQSIAISDIVRAVSMVTGTTSVVVTSPTYALGSDLIPVQPYEKALVTDLSTIQVSFIGE